MRTERLGKQAIEKHTGVIPGTNLSAANAPKAAAERASTLVPQLASSLAGANIRFGTKSHIVEVKGLPQVGTAEVTLYSDYPHLPDGVRDDGKVYILEGSARTPFGKPETLKGFSEVRLAVIAAKASVNNAKLDPSVIKYSAWGCVDQSSAHAKALGHVPRLVGAGDVNSLTLNKQCGSGLSAIQLGADKASRMDPNVDYVALVGGVEKMRPYFYSAGMLNLLKTESDRLQKEYDRMPKWKQKVVGLYRAAPLFVAREVKRLVSKQARRIPRSEGMSFPQQIALKHILKLAKPELRDSLAAVIRGLPNTSDLGWHATAMADPITGATMGDTAETLMRTKGLVPHWIQTKELDEFSLRSHELGRNSWKNGDFDAGDKPEVVPIVDRSGKVILSRDESIRMETAIDGIIGALSTSLKDIASKRKPGKPSSFHNVYKTDAEHSAPNASAVVSGAASALVTNSETLERLKATGKVDSVDPILGQIVAIAEVSVPSKIMGLGAARAAEAVLKGTGLKLEQMGRIEINEAFAGVALSAMHILSNGDPFKYKKIYDRTNVTGGAIAIGHPLGASGTRLAVTVMKQIKRDNLEYGLATLCIGDGQGIAIIVKNPKYQKAG